MMSVSVNTYEDPNGDKNRIQVVLNFEVLVDLTHQFFESGNHYGRRNLRVTVNEMLDKLIKIKRSNPAEP